MDAHTHREIKIVDVDTTILKELPYSVGTGLSEVCCVEQSETNEIPRHLHSKGTLEQNFFSHRKSLAYEGKSKP